MSILKKTIAGALTIALSVGVAGTSAMPVLAASENNIDVLQKNVTKAQEPLMIMALLSSWNLRCAITIAKTLQRRNI